MSVKEQYNKSIVTPDATRINCIYFPYSDYTGGLSWKRPNPFCVGLILSCSGANSGHKLIIIWHQHFIKPSSLHQPCPPFPSSMSPFHPPSSLSRNPLWSLVMTAAALCGFPEAHRSTDKGSVTLATHTHTNKHLVQISKARTKFLSEQLVGQLTSQACKRWEHKNAADLHARSWASFGQIWISWRIMMRLFTVLIIY